MRSPILPFLLLAIVGLTQATTQLDTSYLLLISSTPASLKTFTLPVASFTTNQYSFSFWFKITSTLSQTLISHQYTTSSSSTATEALKISYVANSQYLTLSSQQITINPIDWNFVYIGVDCANGIYFTSINSNTAFDTSLTMTSTAFSGTCLTSSLASITLTIGDSSVASTGPGAFAHFRYYPSILVTKNIEIIDTINREISSWLWLRYPPSEVGSSVQKFRDYSRNNLVVKGYGYNTETYDSSVNLALNSAYSYGNAFTQTTLTTAYADYLGTSFTMTMWMALKTASPDSTASVVFKVKDFFTSVPATMTFGLSPVDSTNLIYDLTLSFSNGTASSGTLKNTTNTLQFAVSSSDPAVTEWLLVIFKFNQFQQIVPNFFSWEVFDVTGNLKLAYKGTSLVILNITNPVFYFGGFSGYLADQRVYKGITPTHTDPDTAYLTSCKIALGSLYLNLTVTPSNTVSTSTLTCSSCISGTFSRLETNQCTSSCPTKFQGDSRTNLCKCTSGDCFSSVTCDSTCGECDGISFENCRTCASGLYLQPSPKSCLSTCPTNYCAVTDVVLGGICAICTQFQPIATLTAINSTYVLLQFSANMALTTGLVNLTTLAMTGYSTSQFTTTFIQLSKKIFALNFTYSTSLSPHPLILTFSTITGVLDENGYQLNPNYKILSVDLPSIFTATQDELNKSNTLTNWALYIIYFMIVSFPILSITGDLGIFWGLVDSAQVMNFLLYINFSLPFNVKQFYEAMSIANLKFFPNIIWKILESSGIDIDLSDQQAPTNFSDHGIENVNFLYNGGRIISIFLIFGICYSVVWLVGNMVFNDYYKELIRKVKGWMVYALIRLFLVGFLQMMFAVFLQLSYPSYKDNFSMVSLILATAFGAFLVWFPIDIIIEIEKIHKAQTNKTRERVNSYLKRIIVEYKFDYFVSRNFVFFLLLRNSALVPVSIYLSSVPLTQSGVFLFVSLIVSLWISALPIYKDPSYTVINLVALAGFGVIGLALFWMIGSSTYNGDSVQSESSFTTGEIMEITSLVVIVMYALHVFWQLMMIGWKYGKSFLEMKNEMKKYDEKDSSRIETESQSLEHRNSKSSRIGMLELNRMGSSRKFDDSGFFFTEESSFRGSRTDKNL